MRCRDFDVKDSDERRYRALCPAVLAFMQRSCEDRLEWWAAGCLVCGVPRTAGHSSVGRLWRQCSPNRNSLPGGSTYLGPVYGICFIAWCAPPRPLMVFWQQINIIQNDTRLLTRILKGVTHKYATLSQSMILFSSFKKLLWKTGLVLSDCVTWQGHLSNLLR